MNSWGNFMPQHAVLQGGYDDDLDQVLNPTGYTGANGYQPDPLEGGVSGRPGILQDPSSVQALGEAWAASLSGLKRAQGRTDKQRTFDDRRDLIDEFAGRVALPLSGAIPGNRKHARDASSALLEDLSKRRQARRDDAGDQMRLTSDLAKVIRAADPDDLNNIIAQKRLDNQLDREKRLQSQGDQRIAQGKERIGLTQQKQKFDQQYKTDWIAMIKSDKAEMRDQGRKRLTAYIDMNTKSLEFKRESLRQQKANFGQMMDWRQLQELNDELDSLDDREMGLWKIQHEMEEALWEREKDKAQVQGTKSPKPKYPGLKDQPMTPPPEMRATPGVLAPSTGAAVQPTAKSMAAPPKPVQKPVQFRSMGNQNSSELLKRIDAAIAKKMQATK